MAARIFTCHHVLPARMFRPNRVFTTLISGVHGNARAGFLGDLDGDNIAGQNVYSEMRHQYYVWRNLLGQYDYVGFEHYRRVFFVDFAPHGSSPERDPWRAEFHSNHYLPYVDIAPDVLADYLDYRAGFDPAGCDAVEAWMSHYDIIVQRPLVRTGLAAQWKSCQPPAVWDIIVRSVREVLSIHGGRCDVPDDLATGYCNNMYIMRAEIFDRYMTFYMECAQRILGQMPAYQRMLGHCGERIFSLWLYQMLLDEPRLRLHQHPFLQSTQALVANLPGHFDGTGAEVPGRQRRASRSIRSAPGGSA